MFVPPSWRRQLVGNFAAGKAMLDTLIPEFAVRLGGATSVDVTQHGIDKGWRYLSCMSLVTDFTPLTALATRTAPLISARELTKPLS